MKKTTFSKKNDIFFKKIKEDIEEYFSQFQIKKTGNYKTYIKSIVFVLFSISCYLTILSFAFPLWIVAILSIFLGASFAGIGFNIMHDSAHGSFSSKKWLNELASYSLNLMGGNVFFWKNKHNINHHTYTNIKGIDEDIEIEPWIRTHTSQPRYWYHRYQHIYCLVLYGFTYFNWVFLEDFKKYFSKKIADVKLNEIKPKEHVIFWISKVIFFSLFLVIPITILGFWKTVFVYTIMSLICGFILGLVFQLAHLVEDTTFPQPLNDSNRMETDWVLHQIATTANFAPQNKIIFWLTGGLNLQVVHHLFPKISHAHYPVINELIKKRCLEFNIKYTEYPTLWSALRSHLSYLKQTGSTA